MCRRAWNWRGSRLYGPGTARPNLGHAGLPVWEHQAAGRAKRLPWRPFSPIPPPPLAAAKRGGQPCAGRAPWPPGSLLCAAAGPAPGGPPARMWGGATAGVEAQAVHPSHAGADAASRGASPPQQPAFPSCGGLRQASTTPPPPFPVPDWQLQSPTQRWAPVVSQVLLRRLRAERTPQARTRPPSPEGLRSRARVSLLPRAGRCSPWPWSKLDDGPVVSLALRGAYRRPVPLQLLGSERTTHLTTCRHVQSCCQGGARARLHTGQDAVAQPDHRTRARGAARRRGRK